MQEIWKDVFGYEGLYQVSNLGRVKSLERKVWNGYSYRTQKSKIISYSINSHGYVIVNLYKNNDRKHYQIHRLVAIAFIENPEYKPEVNHKDGIKINCYESNLEWCTHSENNIHSYRELGRKHAMKDKFGALHHNSKKIVQFDMNGSKLNTYESARDILRCLKIKDYNVTAVCRGKRKSAGGFIWKFEEDLK